MRTYLRKHPCKLEIKSDDDISDALFITPPGIVLNVDNTPALRAPYRIFII